MVARKSSIPVPNVPPPPPPDFGPPQSRHEIDPSNVPPLPATGHRVEEDSPYKDMGNPWADANSSMNAVNRPHPSILRPGASKPAVEMASSEVPDVLKPGWSGQNTPRSSLDSDRSKDFWESSDDEEDDKDKGHGKRDKEKQVKGHNLNTSGSTDDLVIPSALQIKRKPIGVSSREESNPAFPPTSPRSEFASNNPFRRPSSEDQQASIELLPSWGSEAKGKGKAVDSLPSAQFANLSSRDDTFPAYSAYHPAQPKDESALWEQHRPQQQAPAQPQSPPPPIPIPRISSPFSEQPPLIAVSPKVDENINPWSTQPSISATPSPIPFTPSQKQHTQPTDHLLDRGQKADGRISLGDELKALPNAAQTSTSQLSLLDDEAPPPKPSRPLRAKLDEDYRPPPGPPPLHATSQYSLVPNPPPPTKPPRSAFVVEPLSDIEVARMQEQRNETYQIKHFNWYDHRSGKLRTSSMLTQNKNGPCPLLALVNALILGAKDESQAALDDALRPREQVTLGLIIETLMDELLSSSVHLDGELPDVDELNKFLIKLRTGMNMNPRFIQPQAPPPNLMDARNSILHVPTARAQDQPGSFESTQDNKLYSAFGIKTVHGWLPEPDSEAVGAFARSAQNYEDAQVVQFGEEELDYKLTNGGLTPQEQQLWQDIVSIKNFFRLHPTQLTTYGLSCIKQSMQPGSFAILFRNDHFSTIHKHPQDGNLYTLITDAGYADRDEVIWESLVDISGQHSEFFSGDFQSVSHHIPDSSGRRSDRLSVGSGVPEPLSPQQQQEQHDADFAMALQLQEEEEQRMRQQRNNRGGSGPEPAGRGSGAPRRGQGIPIPLRSNNSGIESRPLIPPRNQRPSIPAVNRPSDSLDADAPPTYEEAARGKPYNPPLGSPLHPDSSASAEPSPYNSTSNVNLPATTTNQTSDMPPALRRPERRQSAYTENYERFGHSPRSSNNRFEMGMSPAYNERNPRMPGTYFPTGQGGHGHSVSSGGNAPNAVGRQRRNDDGDCVVM